MPIHALVGKVLPLQVGGDAKGTPISVGLTIERKFAAARREITKPSQSARERG
jgi:hypothetical protein